MTESQNWRWQEEPQDSSSTFKLYSDRSQIETAYTLTSVH